MLGFDNVNHQGCIAPVVDDQALLNSVKCFLYCTRRRLFSTSSLCYVTERSQSLINFPATYSSLTPTNSPEVLLLDLYLMEKVI